MDERRAEWNHRVERMNYHNCCSDALIDPMSRSLTYPIDVIIALGHEIAAFYHMKMLPNMNRSR
ncbi:MAG: hypothetical protein HY517_04500 [Candidatus Aenigmarchaeota archaeon]|nr:hypothetical protein [Candidatus Aenigmarchaeota archaeon]